MGQMRRAGRKLALLAVFAAAVCVAAVAESSPECGVSNGGHDLVPRPRKITLADGFVDAKTQVTERRDGSLPPEGYRLSVAAGGISIVSSSAAGAFYARKTLEQLLKDGRYRVCEIEDAPEYRWRGMMIDEARHFLGKSVVKRVLDLMAMHKMNVFHWHLVDDQGWRLEMKRHPELVQYGAARPESVSHGSSASWPKWNGGNIWFETDGERYGPFFHTQEDVREILAYAKARHITVVPEIEIPGHVRALLAAFPECSCKGASLPRVPRIFWGKEPDVLCIGNDKAVALIEDILDETCGLFPDSPWIHIGGDECPTVRWRECPKCQARIKTEGLKDVNGLQPWITSRIVRYLESRGRRAVGWDEVLAGDVPLSTIGMTWRANGKQGAGTKYVSAAEAVRRGHDMVLTPCSRWYLSTRQGVPHDPHTYLIPGKGFVSLEDVYSFDPSEGVPAECRSHVLGGQASVWGEMIWNLNDLEWKTWPRACAVAEALWSGPAGRDWADFRRRIETHRLNLLDMGYHCAPITQEPPTAPEL